jgi:hypothetical protein
VGHPLYNLTRRRSHLIKITQMSELLEHSYQSGWCPSSVSHPSVRTNTRKRRNTDDDDRKTSDSTCKRRKHVIVSKRHHRGLMCVASFATSFTMVRSSKETVLYQEGSCLRILWEFLRGDSGSRGGGTVELSC